jgi:acyl-CoA thioester hydrolase
LTVLKQLHEASVGEDEIDDLGHMNVRYYAERALQATATLVATHGLGHESCEALNASFEVRDLFTRHYREQMAGAQLAIMGGVLEVDEHGIRIYHELSNTDSGEVAATFVHRAVLLDRESRSALVLPDDVQKSLGESLVAWPKHGRSRSIDLDRAPPPLSLEEARSRGLAFRQERRIQPEECDASGFVPAARRQDLTWGGKPMRAHKGQAGPPMFDLEDGSRMSLAALETRAQLFEPASVGTRIQTFSAIVEVATKTAIRRTWVYDLDHDLLLQSNTLVDIALHLGKRRAMEIPEPVREAFEANAQFDLR